MLNSPLFSVTCYMSSQTMNMHRYSKVGDIFVLFPALHINISMVAKGIPANNCNSKFYKKIYDNFITMINR